MTQQTRFLFALALSFVALGMLFILQSQNQGRLRLIFCDVGQGDGILIMTPAGKQILVDGGPGAKILECLSNNMPFWDRSIDMTLATHAQKDHMEGLLSVLERYDVDTVASNGIGNNSGIYGEWERQVAAEGSRYVHPVTGTKLVLGDGVELTILWPTQEMLEFWAKDPPSDLNETSYVMRLSFAGGCAYLTGDIPKETLEQVLDKPCDILKIAHHGSKTGTSREVLDKAKPKVAVIQVGKNSFGHPTEEVLNLLEADGIRILRNDSMGTVELRIENGQLIISN